jgi:hypothetical protein
VIQLFYILKYQFKLKKRLRVQARRKREDIIKDHAKKIVEILRKKFQGKDFVSQIDLLGLVSKKNILTLRFILKSMEKILQKSSK